MTEYKIPTTDVTITANNEREEKLARIFIRDINSIPEAAKDGYDWAKKVCDIGGSITWNAEQLGGYGDAMFFLGMIEQPFTSVDVARACRTLYLEG